MITRVINDGFVFYQITGSEDALPEIAILLHRDNGDTLVIEQEDRAIMLNMCRGNIREFKTALDKAVTAAEEAARAEGKKRR